jgi:hypothetical protein
VKLAQSNLQVRIVISLDGLETRAERIYPDTELVPDNSRNRREWVAAVRRMRDGTYGRGWVLDGAPVPWGNQAQALAAASSLSS